MIEKLRDATRAVEAALTATTKSSINEVWKLVLPVKLYVFIAIDLEAATLEQREYYPNGANRSPGSGKVYPKRTSTQIGIYILRATGKNEELFPKNSNSKAGTKFCSINVKEFLRYKSRLKKLRTADFRFPHGTSERVALDKVNELLLELMSEESNMEQVKWLAIRYKITKDSWKLATSTLFIASY